MRHRLLDKEHFTRKNHTQLVKAWEWVKIREQGGDTLEFKGSLVRLRAVYQGNGIMRLIKCGGENEVS